MLTDLVKENDFTLKMTRSRQHLTETIMDTDYADAIAILANTPTQAESLLHSLETVVGGTCLHVNKNKMELMYFNQERVISSLKGCLLKLVDKFTYLGSSISSTESDVTMHLAKVWTPINGLSTIWESDLADKIKWDFFQAVLVSILLYGCTTWTLTKYREKAWGKLQQKVTSYTEQILEATPHKTAAVRLLTCHL